MVIINNAGICIAELVIFGVTSKNIVDYIFDKPDYWYAEVWLLTIIASMILVPFIYVNFKNN